MTRRQILLTSFFFSTVLLGVLHWYAVLYGVYERIYWFDWVMHGIGGFVVGMGAAWLCGALSPARCPSGRYRLWGLLAVVLAVGVAWELFEYVAEFPRKDAYALDTTVDLFMDGVGAVGAYLWWKWIG